MQTRYKSKRTSHVGAAADVLEPLTPERADVVESALEHPTSRTNVGLDTMGCSSKMEGPGLFGLSLLGRHLRAPQPAISVLEHFAPGMGMDFAPGMPFDTAPGMPSGWSALVGVEAHK